MPTKQSLSQLQEQQLIQQQRLTAQQILQVKMLEMPLAQIEQAVKAELCDNPAMEADMPDENYDAYGSDVQAGDTAGDEGEHDYDNADDEQERSDREDALDLALESMGSDDRDERLESDYRSRSDNAEPDAEQEEIVYGDTVSFYDRLVQQVADEELNARQREIVEYIIGSLDNDGLLRKDLQTIGDELAIYSSIDCSEQEIEDMLRVLQSFDPAGVGARSLQECLLLQIERREPSEMRRRMTEIIEECFDSFTKKHWKKIASHLHLTEEQTERVIAEIRKLNPRPGSSFGETMGRNTQQITPDFIIDTTLDGNVTFQINQGDVPSLHVSEDFLEQMRGYQLNKGSLNKREKEGLLYIKEKVDRAKWYIESIQKRYNTMQKTMQAIIDIQYKFFSECDESDMVPMTLKDVADRIGMDISTVSRVCNSKYADTRWGIFRLKHFFSDGYTVKGTDEEMSTRRIKVALRETIAAEDKKHPLSDEALAKVLKQKGYPIARRTVAKYREQLGLPVARLRK